MGKDLNGKELGKGITQKKDGRYSARFTNQYGKRMEFKSRNLLETKKWLRDQQYKDEHGILVNGINITVEKWFNSWVDTYKKDVVAYSTYKNYVNSFNSHVKPVIGQMQLKSVKPLHCQSILNELYENAYSFGTCNLCRITMHALFDGAVLNNYIVTNPVNLSVKCKQREVPERRVLTINEQYIFNKYSKDNIYNNAFQFVLQTGLRCGEVGGLMWQDIDFDKKCLKVRRTLLNAKAKGGFYLSTPKTKSSNRVIPLTDQAISILKAQRAQLIKMKSTSTKWDNSSPQFEDLVFKTVNGRPVGQSNFSSALVRVVARINNDRMIMSKLDGTAYNEFTPMYMHCLRHTYATRAIENGIKPKSLQKLLGHANIGVTMDLYVHVTDDELANEAKKISLTQFPSDIDDSDYKWGQDGDDYVSQD